MHSLLRCNNVPCRHDARTLLNDVTLTSKVLSSEAFQLDGFQIAG
jgi:hypothetical protein